MNNEVKVEIKRKPGRPPLAVKTKRPPRKAIRPPEDNADRLQCCRCLVWHPKENYNVKRNLTYYRNCKRCQSKMAEYAAKYKAMKTLKKEE